MRFKFGPYTVAVRAYVVRSHHRRAKPNAHAYVACPRCGEVTQVTSS